MRLCLYFVLLFTSATPEFTNIEVKRSVDLIGHFPRISLLITAKNTGDSNADYYEVLIEPMFKDKVGFMGAAVSPTKELTILESPEMSERGATYKVELPHAVSPGETVEIIVRVFLIRSLELVPKKIKQSESQYAKFHGHVYFYSPYRTVLQNTQITLSSSRVESYTSEYKPVHKTDNILFYGPYHNVEPLNQAPLTVHYLNNNPFLVVRKMVRYIEVSHWGNIAVKEDIELFHTGAELKGGFSRIDYMLHQDGLSSVRAIQTKLPLLASGISYYDKIGNISTSNVKRTSKETVVELKPRFPLFGGWKTKYTLEYNVPTYSYLFNEGSGYLLKMKVVDHVYDDYEVDDLVVKVSLPEGSIITEFSPPYQVERDPDELTFSYLDVFGRPTVVFRKSHLLAPHAKNFIVRYSFQKQMLLIEPCMILGVCFLFFLTVIIFTRLDFSIAKHNEDDSKLGIQVLWGKIAEQKYIRDAAFQRMLSTISSLKAQKDTLAIADAKKRIDAEIKSITHNLLSVGNHMRSFPGDAGEKISEAVRHVTLAKDIFHNYLNVLEKFINGKANKAQIGEAESQAKNKIKELDGKVCVLLRS